MKRGLRRHEEGYSFIELLIALALVGLVLALGYSIYRLGVTLYSRGVDQSTLQQEERYLLEFLPREFRFAYDVELFSSPEEVPMLTENEKILYSDPRGIWQKQGTSDASLFLPVDRVTYDLAFGSQEKSGALLVGYKVSLAKSSPPANYKELSVHLFNAELEDKGEFTDTWATVIKYSTEP